MPAYAVRSGRYYFLALKTRYHANNTKNRYLTSTFLKNWKTFRRALGAGTATPTSDSDVLYWLDRFDQVRLTGTSTTSTATPTTTTSTSTTSTTTTTSTSTTTSTTTTTTS